MRSGKGKINVPPQARIAIQSSARYHAINKRFDELRRELEDVELFFKQQMLKARGEHWEKALAEGKVPRALAEENKRAVDEKIALIDQSTRLRGQIRPIEDELNNLRRDLIVAQRDPNSTLNQINTIQSTIEASEKRLSELKAEESATLKEFNESVKLDLSSIESEEARAAISALERSEMEIRKAREIGAKIDDLDQQLEVAMRKVIDAETDEAEEAAKAEHTQLLAQLRQLQE